MLNELIFLTLLELFAKAEVLQIKNNGQDELLVSVTGLENFLVPSDQTVPVTVPDDFSGTITGVPKDFADLDIPKTRIELTLSPMGDAYDVSIVNGFNIKAKITPLKGRRCKPALCTADINTLCPLRNQVRNSAGTVIGCNHSPFLFKSSCPKAVVTQADVRNVFTCTTDTYFIILG